MKFHGGRPRGSSAAWLRFLSPMTFIPFGGRACVDGVKLPMWILSALLRTFGVECPCCGYWPVAVACARDGAIRFHHFG